MAKDAKGRGDNNDEGRPSSEIPSASAAGIAESPANVRYDSYNNDSPGGADKEFISNVLPVAESRYASGENLLKVTEGSVKKVQKTDADCWTSVMKVARSIWSKRQKEDLRYNRERYIQATLRELVIYFFFLVTLCILTFGMTSSTQFYYTKVMQQLFLDTQFRDVLNNFRGISSMQDFWRFAEHPLMNGLYWETWYNNRKLSEQELGYIYYQNKLLGVPRLRQLKVIDGSCKVHPDFVNNIKTCYDSYTKNMEDTKPFGKKKGMAWMYQTVEELHGSNHWGRLAIYSGAGYVQDLMPKRADAVATIEDLKANLWLDRGTRVVFVDFTVYNANINLFCVVRLVVEFPATGGALSSWRFNTVKLTRYTSSYDYFLMGCEIIYMIFIAYYTIEEVLEIKRHKLSYFTSFWNCLDVFVIFLSLLALVFNIYRTLKVTTLLDDLLKNPHVYPDFEYLAFWQMQYNNMVAIVVFFAWIKIFKYISFNRTMTQLQSTLSRCSKDIAGFAVMFFVIFFAYAQLGYLVFGSKVKDFSTFLESIYTQFRIVLGDFDFHELEQADRWLGPIFFLTYVFFVFFILLNMFLAIINDTYSEVKAEISSQASKLEISDYIKRGYNKILEKLSAKGDRLGDIQDAINTAILNEEGHLDWEDWRVDLKNRGIPDAEIEAIFAKYDVDGDMTLDKEEQRRLLEDLKQERANLIGSLHKIDKKKTTELTSGPHSYKNETPLLDLKQERANLIGGLHKIDKKNTTELTSGPHSYKNETPLLDLKQERANLIGGLHKIDKKKTTELTSGPSPYKNETPLLEDLKQERANLIGSLHKMDKEKTTELTSGPPPYKTEANFNYEYSYTLIGPDSKNPPSQQDFNSVSYRVDKMERNIWTIISRLDDIILALRKLEFDKKICKEKGMLSRKDAYNDNTAPEGFEML